MKIPNVLCLKSFSAGVKVKTPLVLTHRSYRNTRITDGVYVLNITDNTIDNIDCSILSVTIDSLTLLSVVINSFMVKFLIIQRRYTINIMNIF